MGFVDYIKNVFKRNKQDDEESVDLKHANLESTEGKDVELDDQDLSGEDSEAAVRIDKEGSFQKMSAKKTEAKKPESAAPAAKKVNMVCGSCNYKFSRAEDNVPNMCPYCGKDL